MCVLGVGAQVLIEYLFNMFETLGSTPSTAKKIFWLKKKKKKKLCRKLLQTSKQVI